MRIEFWDTEDRFMAYSKLRRNVVVEKDCTTLKSSSSAASLSSLSSSSAMIICIKVPSSNSKFLLIKPKSSDSVFSVKNMIHGEKGISPDRQFLFYNGTLLDDDDKTLATYNVEDWSIIYAVFCPAAFDPTADDGVKKTVIIPGWKTVEMDVKPWYTAREIKAVMESFTGFRAEQLLILSHGGKLLEDSMMIMDDIDKESPIYMIVPLPFEEDYSDSDKDLKEEGDEFKIFIRNSDWEESFWVSKLNRVFEIKKKIENFAALPSDRQFLLYDKTMAKLEDDKTLGFYNIEENSTLWLFTSSLKVFIKMPQVGTTYLVLAHSFDSIIDIKKSISEKMGIPFSSQTLIYAGKLLDDDETLESCNIEMKSVVYAIFGLDDDKKGEELDLTVELNNEDSIEIKVKQWYSISDVKAIIESKTQIPICVQDLYYNHGDLKLKLKDWKIVSDYGSKNKFTVHMEIHSSPVQLFIYTRNGKDSKKDNAIAVEAKNSDTVNAVLDMIPQEEMEIFDGQPCLFLDDTRLMGNKMLAQYGIKSGSLLCLDRLIQINVIVPNGSTIKVDLKGSYKIDTVKEMIEEKCGIPHELQRLTYLGDELDDYLNLEHYEDLLGSLWVLRWSCGGSFCSFFWPSYEGCSINGCNNKWSLKVKFVE